MGKIVGAQDLRSRKARMKGCRRNDVCGSRIVKEVEGGTEFYR